MSASSAFRPADFSVSRKMKYRVSLNEAAAGPLQNLPFSDTAPRADATAAKEAAGRVEPLPEPAAE